MKIVTCTIAIIILASCGGSQDVFVDFPVTAECRDKVIDKLNEITGEVDGFAVDYHPFDFKIDSHQEIEGYIRLSSKLHKSESQLEGYFYSALFACEHTSSTTSGVRELSETIIDLDIEEAYMKLHGGKVTIWFGSRDANK